MPFRFKNARATHQRLVKKMFVEMIRWTMEVYVDNMLVKSRKAIIYINYQDEMFQVLCRYGMRVSSGKFLSIIVHTR